LSVVGAVTEHKSTSLFVLSLPDRAKTLEKWFERSALLLLGAAAVLKVITAFKSQTGRLSVPDPILDFWTTRELLFYVSALELAVCILCVFAQSHVVRLCLIACLSFCFLLYRAGLSWVGAPSLCPCLGQLDDWIGLPPASVEWAGKLALAFLLLGSFSLLTSRYILSKLKRSFPISAAAGNCQEAHHQRMTH
jgi:hypothetical protein